MNGVQTRLKCKPNVKQCKRLVFPARSALFNHNILNTKAISHFQANHILIRFVFPPLNIKMELPTVDLVIGSVLIPGDKAPHLITREMLKMMKPGTVLVDVAIDQGGCFETSHPTTHSEPTYVVDGIVHYAVANIPGAVPFTSTMALTNATLPYTVALACKGWKQACKDDPALALGLNVVEGKVTYKAVADVFGMRYEEIEL